jgi:hypothetical protein
MITRRRILPVAAGCATHDRLDDLAGQSETLTGSAAHAHRLFEKRLLR